MRTVPGTTSVYAERVMGGYYVNIEPDRAALARYGLMVGDVQEVVRSGLGAEAVTTTVEGRERYTVNVRYPQAFRSDPQAIAENVLIPLPNRSYIPLGQVAKVSLAKGPPSVRTENAQLVVYIYVDFRDRDIGGYVADAKKAVAERVRFPQGYYVTWSGQFEYLQRAEARMKIVVPVTLSDHLPAAVPQLPAADRNADRHAQPAVLADRRAMVRLVPGLQPERRRRCRRST